MHKAEAARIVGCGLTTFKRRERAGHYTHVDIDSSGRRLYDRAFLESKKNVRYMRAPESNLPAQANPARIPGRYTMDEVERVFAELEKDENLIRIVRETKVLPEIVEAIHLKWQSLGKQSGGFHLSGDAVRQLARLKLDGFPVSTDRELIAALRALATFSEPCEACGDNPKRVARLCTPCERSLLAPKVGSAHK